MFIPEKTARTVRFNVNLDDGLCTLADRKPLPKLKKGASAELVVYASDLLDREQREDLITEHSILLLEKGHRLWARIKEDEIPEPLKSHREKIVIYPGTPALGIAFDLKDDLKLKMRAAKGSVLCDCECNIPALKLSAASVNEAYTRISTAFEPSRRSHGGNVFNCVFFEGKNGLHALGDLRMAKEVQPVAPEALLSALEQSLTEGTTRITESHLERYDFLREQLPFVNVATDSDFQRTYSGLYRLRFMEKKHRAIYFETMEAQKLSTTLSFPDLLFDYHKRTGRWEVSFISKLIAIIEPNHPVWDSLVSTRLGLALPLQRDHESCSAAYALLETTMRGLLSHELFLKVLQAFALKFPNHNYKP
ncbi:MAG TPA: hypothetical protein VN673_16465, partial [Clostridia bacterium]|nr:hypothetical protein [Clostridia bacterium]